MFYWLTKYSIEDLIQLFDKIPILNISLKITLCFLTQNKSLFHSIHFNYVQIQNSIPYSIHIVNYTDLNHFILLSFYTQKFDKKDRHFFKYGDRIEQCQQNQTLSIPYAFYCQISNLTNINGIFFFNDQCYFLNQTNCMKQLIQLTIIGQEKYIINHLNKKSCGFQKAIFVPKLIDYTTTTGYYSFE